MLHARILFHSQPYEPSVNHFVLAGLVLFVSALFGESDCAIDERGISDQKALHCIVAPLGVLRSSFSPDFRAIPPLF
jgi:hypothetical protein